MIQRQEFCARFLAPRRIALLASVAGVGIAVLAGGPDLRTVSNPTAWISSAVAAESTTQPLGFADVVEKVKPAVISVRVDATAQRTAMNWEDDAKRFGQGSPFGRFFRRFGFNDMPNGMQDWPGDRARPGLPRMGAEGSGFFISADGYAVTNNHVVNNAKSVHVVTDDGKTLSAKVIGTDPKTDLAVIKVDGHNFPFVKFSDRDPRIGDWVVAVGNPFGLGGTVTAGVVSARGREIGSGGNDFIQIDAAINRGNSGGPTFDLDGNVIGVNTAIFSPSGGNVGIGFDIPADTAKVVVAQLMEKGHVTRGWMGVRIQAVTTDIADGLGLKKAEGALVDEPQSGSPAAKAGILAGDVITAVDGKDVKDSRDLARRIGAMAPGNSVKLTILRNGETRTVTLTLGQLPDQRQANADTDERGTRDGGTPRIGLTLAPASDVGGAGDQGVAVTAVDPEGPAAEQGIKTGDVILDVAGKAVSKPEDVRRALVSSHKDGKRAVLMRVKSGDATKFVAVPFGKA
jgi:serine protease Do